MMYKNIIFDFGNVLGTFDEASILRQFCPRESDLPVLKQAIFQNWQAFDAGTIEHSECVRQAVSSVPDSLKECVLNFFESWYKYLTPLTQTWNFIHELKEKGYGIYLLSNAPVQFAEHAPSCYEILKEFDGIVFSAPIKLAKPEPGIYHYLFDKYDLKPEECFFLDDKPENIRTSLEVGMDGIVFTGDIEAVKRMIEF